MSLEGCTCMAVCLDIQKLKASVAAGSVNEDLADQYEELCTNSAVNDGSLPCLLRDKYSTS